MSTQSNRSTHYFTHPLGLKGNDKEVSKTFFTHGQESQDDDDPSHWNIDIQEQRFRELSPIEVMKTDPSVILKSLLGVTLPTIAVYLTSIPVVLSDPTWADLSAAALSIIASTLFIVYVIWRDKKKIAKYYDYDDNGTEHGNGTEHDKDKVYHAGYDNPTFSRKYRLDIYRAGSILLDRLLLTKVEVLSVVNRDLFETSETIMRFIALFTEIVKEVGHGLVVRVPGLGHGVLPRR